MLLKQKRHLPQGHGSQMGQIQDLIMLPWVQIQILPQDSVQWDLAHTSLISCSSTTCTLSSTCILYFQIAPCSGPLHKPFQGPKHCSALPNPHPPLHLADAGHPLVLSMNPTALEILFSIPQSGLTALLLSAPALCLSYHGIPKVHCNCSFACLIPLIC